MYIAECINGRCNLILSVENIVLQEQIVDAERKAAAYLKRFNRLQIDYRNLIAITADLVDTLERSIQGEMVTPEYLEKMCSRLFSNQVRQSVNLSRPGTAAEMLRQSVLPPQGFRIYKLGLKQDFILYNFSSVYNPGRVCQTRVWITTE